MMGGSESECMEFYHNAEGWHHGCHPDDAAMVKETFAAHRHDSTPTSIIYRIRNLKGPVHLVQRQLHVHRDRRHAFPLSVVYER
jgi:hypothetical protein